MIGPTSRHHHTHGVWADAAEAADRQAARSRALSSRRQRKMLVTPAQAARLMQVLSPLTDGELRIRDAVSANPGGSSDGSADKSDALTERSVPFPANTADSPPQIAPSAPYNEAESKRRSLIPSPRHTPPCAHSRRWAFAYPEPQPHPRMAPADALSPIPRPQRSSNAGHHGSLTAPSTRELPTPPTATLPATLEFAVTKVGVPWRGQYPRKLRIGSGRLSTAEPHTARETNQWVLPRDVPRVDVEGEVTIILHVAAWPHAPPWALQRLTFLARSAEEREGIVAALEQAGVH